MNPLSAMMRGVGQGSDQAQSIMPNSYQPQGKAQPQNPFQGSLDLIVERLLSLGHQVKQQGEKFRSEGDELYTMAAKLAKLNSSLTDKVKGDSE